MGDGDHLRVVFFEVFCLFTRVPRLASHDSAQVKSPRLRWGGAEGSQGKLLKAVKVYIEEDNWSSKTHQTKELSSLTPNVHSHHLFFLYLDLSKQSQSERRFDKVCTLPAVDNSRFERAGRMDCESTTFAENNLEIDAWQGRQEWESNLGGRLMLIDLP